MAMTSWCEHCGAIHLEGPFIPQCDRCSPEDNEISNVEGNDSLSAAVGIVRGFIIGVFGWGLAILGVVWVLQ